MKGLCVMSVESVCVGEAATNSGSGSSVVGVGFPADGEFVELRRPDGGVWLSGWLVVGESVRSGVMPGSVGGESVPLVVLSVSGAVSRVSAPPELVVCVPVPDGCALSVGERNLLQHFVRAVEFGIGVEGGRAEAVAETAAVRGDLCSVRAELDSVRRVLGNVQAEFDRRIEEMTDAAHEYADDNSLCEVFDRFMVSQGLRPRRRDFEVEVDATLVVRVSVTCTARNGDDAREDVSASDVERAVADRLGANYSLVDVDDFEVLEVTEA